MCIERDSVEEGSTVPTTFAASKLANALRSAKNVTSLVVRCPRGKASAFVHTNTYLTAATCAVLSVPYRGLHGPEQTA